MRYLRDKIVIVTGAGFSAPANLPIQDKILKEMTEPPAENIIDFALGNESVKFLSVYIQVAIYLLREYASDIDVKNIIVRYNRINFGVKKIIKAFSRYTCNQNETVNSDKKCDGPQKFIAISCAVYNGFQYIHKIPCFSYLIHIICHVYKKCCKEYYRRYKNNRSSRRSSGIKRDYQT